MSTISKPLSGFIFNGAALALASAPWKNNVRALYGFNTAGTSYQVFKPTSQFNSLTQLAQDGVYIVDAATPGFELPGATLTAAGSADMGGAGLGAGPLSFATFDVTNNGGNVQLHVNVASTDAGDHAVLVTTDAYPTGAFKLDLNTEIGIGLGSLPAGASYSVAVVNRLGNLLTRTFTVPASS
ncbi:hypothetical protein ACFQ48_14300 [Hymenobacter caeli]|uniref:Uncharacterized protein n=1 Tax=Hymenobacter caeli TaxID=2735894 RepID=A0ABX2FT03_9BACT|nr:hypothetical protein [Hymenobacter caeli]NRT20092.1 hypothetical protein [Hymenobacter caeli]